MRALRDGDHLRPVAGGIGLPDALSRLGVFKFRHQIRGRHPVGVGGLCLGDLVAFRRILAAAEQIPQRLLVDGADRNEQVRWWLPFRIERLEPAGLGADARQIALCRIVAQRGFVHCPGRVLRGDFGRSVGRLRSGKREWLCTRYDRSSRRHRGQRSKRVGARKYLRRCRHGRHNCGNRLLLERVGTGQRRRSGSADLRHDHIGPLHGIEPSTGQDRRRRKRISRRRRVTKGEPRDIVGIGDDRWQTCGHQAHGGHDEDAGPQLAVRHLGYLSTIANRLNMSSMDG